jgi:SAM-dependent methyltransferase
MIRDILLKKYYPDNTKDGTVIFYDWIRSYIKPNFIVLNVGAGLSTKNKIRSLKGEVKKVIGIDIDESILNNNDLDEGFVIKDDKYPFDDNVFDLIWSDYVLEHIRNPLHFFKEIFRVMKPGASFFFRTPNKYHYISILGRLSPYWIHGLFSNKMRSLPTNSHEPYKTYYKINSKTDITKYMRMSNFINCEFKFIEAQPSYLVFNKYMFLIGVFYERILNRYHSLSTIRANIFGRLIK